jgi:hypothetical protein
MNRTDHSRRKLQISGALVILGLLLEAVCLLWSRPIALLFSLAREDS